MSSYNDERDRGRNRPDAQLPSERQRRSSHSSPPHGAATEADELPPVAANKRFAASDGHVSSRRTQSPLPAAASVASAGTTVSRTHGQHESHREDNMTDYIAKRRQIGMLQMALNTKRTEMKKLDDECDLAEKRVKQQRLQLRHTREKFNHFLKYSNLEQDAAIKKADEETRNKQNKLLEIKRLNSLIASGETERRRMEEQLNHGMAYKVFLDKLTKPQWFYDVLRDLRAEDAKAEVASAAKEEFERQSAAIREEYNRRAAERELTEAASTSTREGSVAQRSSGAGGSVSTTSPPLKGKGGANTKAGGKDSLKRPSAAKDDRKAPEFLQGGGSTSEFPGQDENDVVPLEVKLKEAHEVILEASKKTLSERVAAIEAEVHPSVMTLEAVEEHIDNDYDAKRVPMFFTDVNKILDIFIQVEEENLFLIKNCQELEEELENVLMEYAQECTAMESMVVQRSEQMEGIAAKIKSQRKQLQVIEHRIASIKRTEPDKPSSPKAAADAGPGGSSGNHRDANKGEAPHKTQEELKSLIEEKVLQLFRTLTPNMILNQTSATDGIGTIGDSSSARKLPAIAPRSSASGPTAQATGGNNGGDGGGASMKGRKLPPVKKKNGTATGTADAESTSPLAPSSSNAETSAADQANLDVIGMLTIIESRLEAMHAYLVPPAPVEQARVNVRQSNASSSTQSLPVPASAGTRAANPLGGVDPVLVTSILRANDKDRRRQARLARLKNQAEEQEERSRRALERSQASTKKRLGKPVMFRSYLPKKQGNASTTFSTTAPLAMDEENDAESSAVGGDVNMTSGRAQTANS